MTNNYQYQELFKLKTKRFAVRTLRLYNALPQKDDARILGKQLIRSTTSVAANYRAACRARSISEFAAKIGIALEEADESLFWLELLEESGILPTSSLSEIKKEAAELTAILTKARKTAVSKK